MNLTTNQIFHGGLWVVLYNNSVKPKLEITNRKIHNNGLSFYVFRNKSVDVYRAWMIQIELVVVNNHPVNNYSQNELSSLSKNNINNYYIGKVTPGLVHIV